METRFLSVLLAKALLLAAVFPVQAQEDTRANDQVIDPSVERRDIKRADLDTENFEIGAYVGVLSIEDFGTNSVVGIKAAYHITEDVFTELNFGYSKGGETSYEKLSGSAPLLTSDERKYKYWNINLAYNILPGEAFWSQNKVFNNALYLIGGVGSTDFGGDNNFTVNLGFGYRLLLTDAFALRLDVRDHMFDSSLLGEEELKHNFEGTVGLTWFF